MKNCDWDKMTLNEKIRWRNRHFVTKSWVFADKILAKEIAIKRAPECKTSKIIHIPSRLEDINIQELPESYVFKANHGSGWVKRVKNGRNIVNGEKISDDYLISHARRWLDRIYGNYGERQYLLIKPQVFFEEYLEDFLEFRFFCFHGKVKFIMVDSETERGKRSSIYDTNWNRIPARWFDPEGNDVEKPEDLSRFIDIVEKLATQIDFIRIDTYIKGNALYFGEFTFTPNAGKAKIFPQEYDELWGSYWTYDMSDGNGLQVPAGINDPSPTSRLHAKTAITARKVKYKIKRLPKELNMAIFQK